MKGRSNYAVVFDIQRGSLNDGPGIRTSFFFKSCPLRCEWCHNPESWSPGIELSQDNRNSIDEFIPEGQRELWIGKGDVVCGEPEVIYHSGILEFTDSSRGRVYTVEDLIKIATKDLRFYEDSGGGVTLSGGEPMMQWEFVLEFLKELKQRNIHTCLDTSGYADPEGFQKVLPFTDLILYDLKISDPDKHREYTGKSNRLIMGNLSWLLDQESTNLILRCPVIPGVNDNHTHFRYLAGLSRQKRVLGLEIMPYHDVYKGKKYLPQQGSDLKHFRVPTEEEIMKWKSYLKEQGAVFVNQTF